MADNSEWTELWAIADLTTPMAVRVAATLHLADRVAEGLCSAPLLAEAVGADPEALDRLLRHLITAGLLRRDESRLVLTSLGELLRDDHPAGMRRRLDIDGAVGHADLSLCGLLHAIRTGEAAYPAQFGRTFWEDLSADAQLSDSFDRLMGADVSAEAPAIVAACDWGSFGHVVDVGGGNGALLIAMLGAFPGLRGTVVDLPGAARAARSRAVEAGLAQRIEVVAGSFFDPLPTGAGAYVLSAILHNWDDVTARTILRRCAQAAGKGGPVFVIERMGADGEVIDTARDLRMMAYFGGRERNLDEITALADGAGLDVASVHEAQPNAVIELTTR